MPQIEKNRVLLERLNQSDMSSWNNIPIPVQATLSDVVECLVTSTTASQSGKSDLDMVIDTIITVIKFIEQGNQQMRSSVQDRITYLNNKTESEQTQALEMIHLRMHEMQKQAIEMAANDTANSVDQLRKELNFLMAENKRDIVKIARHELDTKVSEVIREEIHLPGLIGHGCKYSNFQRFMMDLNRQVQHNYNDLRVFKEEFMDQIGQLDMSMK